MGQNKIDEFYLMFDMLKRRGGKPDQLAPHWPAPQSYCGLEFSTRPA